MRKVSHRAQVQLTLHEIGKKPLHIPMCRQSCLERFHQGVELGEPAPFGIFRGSARWSYPRTIDGIQKQLLSGNCQRSEERRVGKEGVSPCRAGWWPYH